MSSPIRIPVPVAPGMRCVRTGMRLPRGHEVDPHAGEIVATFGFGLFPAQRPTTLPEIATEDLCLSLVAAGEGRVELDREQSLGGWFDVLPQQVWDQDLTIGTAHGEVPRLVYTAGRRAFRAAEVDISLSTLRGWHDRVRVFWDGPGTDRVDLAVLGTCDARGALMGEQWPGSELMAALPGPVHMRAWPDHVVVQPAIALLEGLRRTEADRTAILSDLGAVFARLLSVAAPAGGPAPPRVTKSWLFAAAIADQLTAPSPLVDEPQVIRGGRLEPAGAPTVVVLSLQSELAMLMRHKRLGYHLGLYWFRILEHGPAILAWLKRDFEPIAGSVPERVASLVALVDVLNQRGAHVVIVGSGRFNEEIATYAGLPQGGTGNGVRFRQLALALREGLAGRSATFVDVEAIGAEVGSRHTLIGAHHAGPVMDEIRAQIVASIRSRMIG